MIYCALLHQYKTKTKKFTSFLHAYIYLELKNDLYEFLMLTKTLADEPLNNVCEFFLWLMIFSGIVFIL